MGSARTAAEPSARERVVKYRADRSLSSERAAARISAYLYGNIIVFASLVPLTPADVAHGHALKLVAGVAVSTFLAHVFAEIVGHQVRAGAPMARSEVRHELRDSQPVGTSAVVPAVLLAAATAGWIGEHAAVLSSEIYLLIRLALVGFLVERLRSDRLSVRTLFAGLALAAVAAGISVLKALVGH